MKKTTLLISLLALTAGAAFAADEPPCGPHERFAERFDKADTDHDGKLTLAEAQAGMPRLAKIFDQIDTKKQGYLTQDDIKAWMADHRRPHGKADERFAKSFAERFDKADTNHDGKLTLAEAQAGMPRLAKIFDQIDTKKQGYLTQDDIKAFMESHHHGRRCAKQAQSN